MRLTYYFKMNTLAEMKQIIADMEPNAHALYELNKSTYSVKLRNNALALQKLCARMRVEAQTYKLNVQGGRVGPQPPEPQQLETQEVQEPASILPPLPTQPIQIASRGRGRGRGTPSQ